MNDRYNTFQGIKRDLYSVWHPFFSRFGQINPIQKEIIPHVLAGKNLIVCSPAASGKTEAVFAPLIQRLLREGHREGLNLLYIAPTRALVNNIFYRLKDVLAHCGFKAAIKTGDRPQYSSTANIQILFTTPESFDSLLCRWPGIWSNLRAIVLDEIHLLDGNYRGDQLRILLERLRQEHSKVSLQYIALSATLYDPEGTAQRYFQPVMALKLGHPRPISLRLFARLPELIGFIREERLHKVLIFANSRREVERLATQLKSLWPPERIILHHASLSKNLRESAEEMLRQWRWGICIATTTLEVGIDIGDFEAVVCYHPPPTPSSFQQRIGRGCRRQDTLRVIGFFSNEAERDCFRLYTQMAQAGVTEPLDYRPDPSVVIQQVFSYLFSHPGGAELPRLRSLFCPFVDAYRLDLILQHLIEKGYIYIRMNKLFASQRLMDLAEKGYIHSNIPNYKEYQVINRDDGKQIGELGMEAVPGTIFVLGGRVWETDSIKGRNIYVHPIAQRPEVQHFTQKKSRGAFYYLLPKDL